MAYKIHKEDAQKLILSSSNIIHVKFVKKDGSIRDMNCRLGVKKHLSGGSSTTKAYSNYITVYDMNKLGYRNINMETLLSFKINGLTYEIIK